METFKETDLKEVKNIQKEIDKLVTKGFQTDFGDIRQELVQHWEGEAATKYLANYDLMVSKMKKINTAMKELVVAIEQMNKTSKTADQNSETVFTK